MRMSAFVGPFRLSDNESAVVALRSRGTTYKLFRLWLVEHFTMTRFSRIEHTRDIKKKNSISGHARATRAF